ncbi:MAG TPA: hypothetical protein VHD32_14265 [Candidatus Didemnitutus sp.]|nr:hypothetical protein [Candidatus Didemnitutus sp.]
MKRLLRLTLATVMIGLIALPLRAASSSTKGKDGEIPTAGFELSKTMTKVTGIAISPLLGVSVVGAYDWYKADTDQQRAALPWFANPVFWVPCLLLVLACAAKDTFGVAIPPGLKKPFDVLETMENKLTGLVAAGAVVPVLVNEASKALAQPHSSALANSYFGHLAMVHFASAGFGAWALDILMVPLAIAIFAIVWVASHAINVLILLSPWGGVDAALKGMRTSLLGLLTLTAFIDPRVGAVLSLIILVIAYFIAGWAFRLTIFGTIFCWDFFTRRRTRFEVESDGNKVFMGAEIKRVPVRTYGRLHRNPDGGLVFRYRPLLVLPVRELILTRDGLVVGRGVFYSEVRMPEMGDPESLRTLLLLPPRYLGHEDAFNRTYQFSGTRDIGLRRAWAWLKETLFGRKKAVPAAATG